MSTTPTAEWPSRHEQAITIFERNAQSNQVLASTDPLGRRTAYTYDAKGNTTSVTRLAGTSQPSTTTMTYEPVFNQLTSVTDPLGRLTQYRYDARGNLIEVQNPLGQVTAISYDATGRPLSITDPLNNITRLAYDGADLKTITDPLTRVVSQLTDAAGRVIARTDPLGNTARREYDRRDLATRSIDAVGNVTTMSYDANRNLRTVVDAKGGTWTYTYDGKDRVISVSNPLGKVKSYTYDGKENLTQLTQRNGNITTFTYDALGRRTKAEHGRQLQGGSLTAPDATITYTYDAGSRLLQLVDTQGGTVSRTFDDLNRLTQESTGKGTVTYTYDGANRRLSMTAGSQATTSYTYDNNNALLSITRGALQAAFSYDAAMRVATITLPNGIVGTYSYDAASQLTGLTYKLGTSTVGDLSYQYDAAGRRTQMGGSLASTGLPQDMAAASYDAANQLVSWAGTAHSYDDNGNLTSDGQRTYSYDSRNRLKTIAGAASASFSYDALGRRTDRTVGAVSTGYLYDGLNAVQELSGTNVKADLLTGLGIDQVLAHTDSAGTKSLLSDALGSTLALADGSAVLQSRYSYEPYGQTTPSGAASENSVQYTGRENDGTGLYFYRARYYSPLTGRFTQTDPIGLAGGINTFAYVNGDPIAYSDPTGQVAANGAAAVAGGVFGGAFGFFSAFAYQFGKCNDFENIDWWSVASSTALGAVSGAITGATFGAGGAATQAAVAGTAGMATGHVAGGMWAGFESMKNPSYHPSSCSCKKL